MILDDIPDDQALVASLCCDDKENEFIDHVFENCKPTQETTKGGRLMMNEVAKVLGDITGSLNDETLYARLNERAQIGTFAMSVGSTDAVKSRYLIENDGDESDDDSSFDSDIFRRSHRPTHPHHSL